MTEMEDLLTMCRQWTQREEEITVIEAVTLLKEFYMEQSGGGSLTLRTLAYESGAYWLYKLSLKDHPLAERAGKDSFILMMPHFSEEFARNKQHYWDYGIFNLYEDALARGMTDIMIDKCIDDKLRIAFACGFIGYYKENKEFERTYNAWIKAK